MSNLTPESNIGQGKKFPLQSSMSGYTPEQTIGGNNPSFPGAESHIQTGASKVTPEKTIAGGFSPTDSQLNT